MNLFLLAAGLGTRLRPLTTKYPKPCVPFLNVPMGLYTFRYLKGLPVKQAAANSFHLSEQIEKLYQNQNYFNDLLISKESEKILGSAGGLKAAAKLYSHDAETLLMMNADEIFFTENENFLVEAYEQHLQHKNLATLVVTKHPEAGQKFGAIWCKDNRVSRIMPAQKKPENDLTPYHYIGIIFLNKKILKLIPDNKETNIFYDVLINELSKNSVEIYNLNCTWYETGNPKDYLSATQAVLNSLDSHTLKFINQYDESTLIKNPTGVSLISKSVSINPEKLTGYNVISKSCDLAQLRNLNKIENSVLFEKEILNPGYFT